MKKAVTFGRRFAGPFSEQLVTSLGNFLFMVVGARLLGIDGFGIVGLLWALTQVPSMFFFALVLLPISSNTNAVNKNKVISHAWAVYWGLILVFALIHGPLVSVVGGANFALTPETRVLLLSWAILQMSHELLRWLVVRYSTYKILLFSSLCRWPVFFLLVAFVPYAHSGIGYIWLNIAMLAFWVLSAVVFSWRDLDPLHILPRIWPEQLKAAMPYLSNGTANSIINLCATYCLSNFFGLAAVGAHQAFRSLSNGFGVIAQFLDNHFTSHFSRNDTAFHLSPRYLVPALSMLLVVLLATWFAADLVITLIIGKQFLAFSAALPFIVMGIVSQVVTRPIFAYLRLHGKQPLLFFTSTVATVVSVPLIFMFSMQGMAEGPMAIASLTPVALLLLLNKGKLGIYSTDGGR